MLVSILATFSLTCLNLMPERIQSNDMVILSNIQVTLDFIYLFIILFFFWGGGGAGWEVLHNWTAHPTPHHFILQVFK